MENHRKPVETIHGQKEKFNEELEILFKKPESLELENTINKMITTIALTIGSMKQKKDSLLIEKSCEISQPEEKK